MYINLPKSLVLAASLAARRAAVLHGGTAHLHRSWFGLGRGGMEHVSGGGPFRGAFHMYCINKIEKCVVDAQGLSSVPGYDGHTALQYPGCQTLIADKEEYLVHEVHEKQVHQPPTFRTFGVVGAALIGHEWGDISGPGGSSQTRYPGHRTTEGPNFRRSGQSCTSLQDKQRLRATAVASGMTRFGGGLEWAQGVRCDGDAGEAGEIGVVAPERGGLDDVKSLIEVSTLVGMVHERAGRLTLSRSRRSVHGGVDEADCWV